MRPEIRMTKYPNPKEIRSPKSEPHSSYPRLHIINNRLPEQSGSLFQIVRLLSLLVAALR